MLAPGESAAAEGLASLRRFAEIDWDFTAQASESAFSAIHWHPCRFPSQIPALAIGRMSALGDLVLDPFMGSATTLVEAQRLGRRPIGIDVNPVSCLLAKAKTLTVNAGDVIAVASALRLRIATSWSAVSILDPPASVQGDKWYMPVVLADLTRLWKLVNEEEGAGLLIAQACFSAILLPACREDRHWGYVCDNTTPKGSRSPDVKSLFLAALQRLTYAYTSRQLTAGSSFHSAKIVNDDAASALANLPEEHVDCVVTSPPYFGVADYIKAQRLTMEWTSQAIEPVRRREIGARSKRHRLTAHEEYISELSLVFQQIYRVLKTGGKAIIVFGQSPSRADAQTQFVDSLHAMGFTLDLQRRRHIPVARRQKPSLVQETVFMVTK